MFRRSGGSATRDDVALDDVPGPQLPAAVETLCYGLWPQRYLHWCARKFGNRFSLHLPAIGTSVVLADSAAICDVFTLKPHQIATNGAILEPFLGAQSLLCQDGEVHHRQRRLLAKAFRPESLSIYGETMESIVTREVESWPIGRPFALHPRLQAITLEVILRVAFGIDPSARLDYLRASLRPFLHQAGSLLVLNPGFRRELRGHGPWARFQRLRTDVLRALSDEVTRRRQVPDLATRRDVLSLLLAADSDGDQLDDDEVLDNLLTMVLAGHDTTATALAWTFDLLLHHPAVMERLEADLTEGGRSYLGAVVKEAMRLRPVIIDTGRALVEPARIGGHPYAAGTVVTPSILLAHHSPHTYSDPMEFRPERFLDEHAPEPLTWIPFGGGIRRCLGAGFATLEMEVVTRTILQHCELSPARRRRDSQRRRAITLIPRHGTRVLLNRRRTATAALRHP